MAVVAKTRKAFRGNVRKGMQQAIAKLESLRKYNAEHQDIRPVLFDDATAVIVQNLQLFMQQRLDLRILA